MDTTFETICFHWPVLNFDQVVDSRFLQKKWIFDKVLLVNKTGKLGVFYSVCGEGESLRRPLPGNS